MQTCYWSNTVYFTVAFTFLVDGEALGIKTAIAKHFLLTLPVETTEHNKLVSF